MTMLVAAVIGAVASGPGAGSRAEAVDGPAAPAPRTWLASPESGAMVTVTVNPVTGRICADATVTRSEPTGLAVRVDEVLTTLAGPAPGPGLSGCSVAPEVVAGVQRGAASAVLTTSAQPEGSAEAPLRSAPDPSVDGVAERSFTLTDAARPTARRAGRRVVRRPGRSIVVTVTYPARVGDEPVLTGPYPVLLFAHGFAVTPAYYRRTISSLVTGGYVVVAPTFPGSAGVGPCCPTEADLGQQPRDLTLALSQVQQGSQDPSSFLGGLVDLAHVAAIGHSDGGSTVAELVQNPRLRDARIGAAVILAGGRLTRTPVAGRTVPTLLLAGERDEYNPQAVFARVFTAARGPRLWVQVVRGSHAAPFVEAGATPEVLRRLELAFLDLWLRNIDTRDVIRDLQARPGVTRSRGGGF
jgi:dienelactone hydrolase